MAEKSLVNDEAVMLTAVLPPVVVPVVDSSSSESLPQAASITTATPIAPRRIPARLIRTFTTTPFGRGNHSR